MKNRKHFEDRLVFGILGDVGYIVKKPGHGMQTDKKLQANLKKRDNEASGANELKNVERREREANFWIRSNKRSMKANVNRLVDLALQGRNEVDANEKRNRLKVMMLNEQSALYQEYTDAALKRADVEYQLKKERAEGIENRAADLEKAFVKTSLDRMFKSNCEELRQRIMKMNRQAIGRVQKMQMEEKRLMQVMNEEERGFWRNLMTQEEEIEERRAAQEAANKVQIVNDYFADLHTQIEGMKRKQENIDCLENVEERRRQEHQQVDEDQFNARMELARRDRQIHNRELQEQMEMIRLTQLKSKEEDEAVGRLLNNEDGKALQREKDAYTDNREQLRKELNRFKNSIGEYRKASEIVERESENVAYQQSVFDENERMAARNRTKQTSRNVHLACVSEQKRQEAEKKRALDTARNQEAVESKFERFRINENVEPIGLNEMRNDARNCWIQRDAKVNFENERFARKLREREKLESEENLRQTRDKYDRKFNELLSQPLQFNAGSGIHPFVTLVSSTQSRT